MKLEREAGVNNAMRGYVKNLGLYTQVMETIENYRGMKLEWGGGHTGFA